MDGKSREIKIVELLTENQSRLYAYIYGMTGNMHRAHEILQETNIVLWQKADGFDIERPFLPWAMGFAKNKVLSARKKFARDKLVFSEEVMNILENTASEEMDDFSDRLDKLPECLDKLPPDQEKLIRLRYHEGQPLEKIARLLNDTPNRLAVQIFRIRKILGECIENSI